MQTPSTETKSTETKKTPNVRSGQMKLLGIIAVAFLPVLAAMVMYFGQFGIPKGLTNKGALILPPIDAEALGIFGLTDSELLRQEDGKRKWLLTLIAGDKCTKRCEEALYLSRQVNTALGKNSRRVGRVLLKAGSVDRIEEILNEHQNLQIVNVEENVLNQISDRLKTDSLDPQAFDILIMDPNGNIIMHYGNGHTGNQILNDFKRLLKVSKVG